MNFQFNNFNFIIALILHYVVFSLNQVGNTLNINGSIPRLNQIFPTSNNLLMSQGLPEAYNDESLKTYQDLLQLARDSNERQLEGMALVSIGSIYLFQEQFAQAIAHLEPGLKIAEEFNDLVSQKRALINLSSAYLNIGEPDKTTQITQKLLAIAERENDLTVKAAGLHALGSADFYRGNFQQSIDYYQQSLAIAEQLQDKESMAILLAALGEVYLALGDSATAAKYIERSQEIKRASQQTNANELLTIQPSDTWNIVVAKAISLRQLGRQDDAVAAFKQYGEMFAATDSTTEQYSRTAQQFTQQLGNLGLAGGVYIYEIVPGGTASQAGLKVGDIVIEYNGKTITNMNELESVRDNAPQSVPLTITYLRLGTDGMFNSYRATVSNPMGAGFMPI